jgi:hypothetical protein
VSNFFLFANFALSILAASSIETLRIRGFGAGITLRQGEAEFIAVKKPVTVIVQFSTGTEAS